MKDIAAGEELHHSYVDCALPKFQRIEKLREIYGFECSCSRCTGNLKISSSVTEIDSSNILILLNELFEESNANIQEELSLNCNYEVNNLVENDDISFPPSAQHSKIDDLLIETITSRVI